jgi:hypothetical protein
MGGLCVNGTLQVLWPGKGLELLLGNASSDFCFIWATDRDRQTERKGMRNESGVIERERRGKNMSQYKGCTKLDCPLSLG